MAWQFIHEKHQTLPLFCHTGDDEEGQFTPIQLCIAYYQLHDIAHYLSLPAPQPSQGT